MASPPGFLLQGFPEQIKVKAKFPSKCERPLHDRTAPVQPVNIATALAVDSAFEVPTSVPRT